MEYDEYEPEPTLKERAIMLAWRSIPYAVGILVLCVLVWIVCSFAARIDDKSASSQWGCVIESARRNLKNGREGQ
jgi:hypothetical protein